MRQQNGHFFYNFHNLLFNRFPSPALSPVIVHAKYLSVFPRRYN